MSAEQIKCNELVEQGKKALALSDWEGAVEKYAAALEIMRSMHGDSAPESAPLLLPYGKALVEIAIENQGVLGKEEPEKENDEGQEEAGPSTNQPTASASGEPAEEQEEEEETEDDDFTIAWEILDLARILYQKRQSSGEDVGRELGECFGLLGDVSLENENFPQAVEDYKSALESYSIALPSSSREIASSHYKLAIVLENIPDRREEALENVRLAIESVRMRKGIVDGGEDPDKKQKEDVQGKGKGKKQEVGIKLSDEEREKKSKDLQEQLGDLEAKLEDLKTSPQQRDVVEESVAHLLGNAPTDIPASIGSAVQSGVDAVKNADVASSIAGAGQKVAEQVAPKVNDLTGMVRRKGKKAGDVVADQAGKGKEVAVDQAGKTADVVLDQAGKAKEVALDQAEQAKQVALEQATKAKDAIVDQASGLADVLADKADQAADVLATKAVQAQSALMDVGAQAQSALASAADQVSVSVSTATDSAAQTAQSVEKDLVERAGQAASDMKHRMDETLRSAGETIEKLQHAGQDTLRDTIGALKRTAEGVYAEVMQEGKELTEGGVEALTGVADDLSKTTSLAEGLVENAEKKAKGAYSAAVQAGTALVDEVMEEGKDMTRSTVEDVVGAAEEVMEGIERVGREGKRKVDEVAPEPVQEEGNKKQKTQ